MKVIIAGPTGFIGSSILRRCLLNPRITSVVAITRRQLPDELGGRKLRQVIIREEQDWLEWKDERNIKEFEDASACIWCIGGRPKSFASPDEFVQVTYTYATSFIKALLQTNLAQRFRFCYMSSWGADLTEKKFRIFDKRNAYLKGRTEKELFSLTREATIEKGWELYTFRPGTVLDSQCQITRNGFKAGVFGSVVPSIGINTLTAAVLDVSLRGYGDEGLSVFFENKEIIGKGEEAEVLEAEEIKNFEEQCKRLRDDKGRWG